MAIGLAIGPNDLATVGENNDGGQSRVARQLSLLSGYVRLDGVWVY